MASGIIKFLKPDGALPNDKGYAMDVNELKPLVFAMLK
jgi:hypothetical protein